VDETAYEVRDPAPRAARALLALGLTALLCALGPAPALSAIQLSGDCTSPSAIRGTPLDDNLVGTEGDDVICGLGGNDTIDGRGGDDLLDGGLGNDSLQGGAGNDTVTYHDRNSSVTVDISPVGGTGGETAIGESDQYLQLENLVGGRGNDKLVGSQDGNILDGGPGSDRLEPFFGFDTVDYSSRSAPVRVVLTDKLTDQTGCPILDLRPIDPSPNGIVQGTTDPTKFKAVLTGGHSFASGDLVTISGATPAEANGTFAISAVTPTTFEFGTGATSSTAGGGGTASTPHCGTGGEAGENDIIDSRHTENVVGGSGNDTLIGNDPGDEPRERALIQPGENRLSGGPGDDLLDGRSAPDVFEGGPGNDTVSYADRTAPVRATIDGVGDDGDASDLEPTSRRRDSIGTDIENVIGGSGDDVLRGDEDPNELRGGAGNDLVNGGAGPDTLFGESGDDTLQGAGGDDSLLGGVGNDGLDGGAGGDRLDGESGDDVLVGGAGPDAIGGGEGSDVADYSAALTRVTVNPNGAADDGTAGEGDNVAVDVEGATGGADHDLLIGNGANGVLRGGGGDDTLDGGGGADTLIGDAGNDMASYASRSAAVTVNLAAPGGDGQPGENDDVKGDVEKLRAGLGNDTLVGDGGTNFLDGGPGNDTLNAGGGQDLVNGGSGSDSLEGADGNDTLNGEAGTDSLRGGGGNDTLNGGSGDDSLDGGAGADSLSGNGGSDTANYASRTRNVNVTLDGGANDGEAREGDNARTDVRNVRTGAGNDRINSRDGVSGRISCGRGDDRVIADRSDAIAADCEGRVAAAARCSILRRAVKMSRKGIVPVRIRCPGRARGRLSLEVRRRAARKSDQPGEAAARRKARTLRLGSKRFSIRKAGKAKTVRVKLTRKGRRMVMRQKRLRVRATASVRLRRGAVRRSVRRKVSRGITVRAPGSRARRKR
jgi:Ca2+-binding RTX toxin-like protein